MTNDSRNGAISRSIAKRHRAAAVLGRGSVIAVPSSIITCGFSVEFPRTCTTKRKGGGTLLIYVAGFLHRVEIKLMESPITRYLSLTNGNINTVSAIGLKNCVLERANVRSAHVKIIFYRSAISFYTNVTSAVTVIVSAKLSAENSIERA